MRARIARARALVARGGGRVRPHRNASRGATCGSRTRCVARVRRLARTACMSGGRAALLGGARARFAGAATARRVVGGHGVAGTCWLVGAQWSPDLARRLLAPTAHQREWHRAPCSKRTGAERRCAAAKWFGDGVFRWGRLGRVTLHKQERIRSPSGRSRPRGRRCPCHRHDKLVHERLCRGIWSLERGSHIGQTKDETESPGPLPGYLVVWGYLVYCPPLPFWGR